jgi:hypothetical protein
MWGRAVILSLFFSMLARRCARVGEAPMPALCAREALAPCACAGEGHREEEEVRHEGGPMGRRRRAATQVMAAARGLGRLPC